VTDELETKTRLILPTNWDEKLIERVAPMRPAYVYGSLPGERTLRTETQLPAVSEERAADHIAQAAATGIGFLYVMNATCMGNRELSEQGRWEILQRCEWLSEVGAAGVTMSNPYVIELVKASFPDLEVHISVLAAVNSARKASFYRDLGAHTIYVAPEVNRDFPRLKAIRRAVECEVAVLVNEGCLLHCPMSQYHANVISHSHESIAGRYHVDYCYFKCSLIKMTDPAEYLKMPWIRPEDLAAYETTGVNYAKLAGREKMGKGGPGSHTDWIVASATAYHERRSKDVASLLVALEPVLSLAGEPHAGPDVHIDAEQLDGFLEFFQKGGCRMDCTTCRWCNKWADRAVTVEAARSEYVSELQDDIDTIRVGSYWTGAPS
jgi:collagenase-like PrtC family protease